MESGRETGDGSMVRWRGEVRLEEWKSEAGSVVVEAEGLTLW